jgi:hypothetical protein
MALALARVSRASTTTKFPLDATVRHRNAGGVAARTPLQGGPLGTSLAVTHFVSTIGALVGVGAAILRRGRVTHDLRRLV